MKAGRRAVVGAVAMAVVAGASPAAAQRSVPVELRCAVVPANSKSAQELVLVGRSGQVYRATEPGRWTRDSAGGIAGQLTSAVSDPRHPGGFIAIAGRPTPFIRRGTVWHAEPVGVRFAALAGPCSQAPAFAERNNIYVLDDGRWKRRGRTGPRIRALIAPTITDIWLLGRDGSIWHHDGRSARERVPATGARGRKGISAAVERLVAGQPGRAYARAEDGSWYRIGKRSLDRLAMPSLPGPFRETAAGPGPDGALVVVGWTDDPAGAAQFTVLTDNAGQLVAATGPANLDPADPIALVIGHSASGELLLASRRGIVHIRDKAGSWTRGQIDPRPPEGPIPAAQAAPARAN